MALARAHVWNAGDILKAADQNGEFNNILNNPISLISPSTGAINFNLQSHTNLLPSAITATSASNGQVLQVSGGNSVWAAAPAAFFPSRVSNLQGLISSQSGLFTADSYLMRTTGGTQSWTVTATSSFSVSIGTAGPAANGRDIAGAFASTYVHWYAISTGSGSTAPAGLVSTNPPTVGPAALPANYSGWTYLGASPYSSASTAVTSTHQFRGNQMFFLNRGDNLILSAGSVQTSLTQVSYSTVVPPNAPKIMVQILAGAAVAGAISVDQASTFQQVPQVTGGVEYVVVPQTSLGLSYQMGAGAGSLNINLMGYFMPNGDV